MLTTGNKFFVINSLRIHEVFELLLVMKEKYAGDIAADLIEKCCKTTEEWYHDELSSVATMKLLAGLEESNLPLLTYHM
jgi:hypothetical protein